MIYAIISVFPADKEALLPPKNKRVRIYTQEVVVEEDTSSKKQGKKKKKQKVQWAMLFHVSCLFISVYFSEQV